MESPKVKIQCFIFLILKTLGFEVGRRFYRPIASKFTYYESQHWQQPNEPSLL